MGGDDGIGREDPQAERRASTWPSLALVAAVAAAVGAFAAANWRTRLFSLVFANVNIKAGIVILASAAMGFVLGWVFLRHVVDRGR